MSLREKGLGSSYHHKNGYFQQTNSRLHAWAVIQRTTPPWTSASKRATLPVLVRRAGHKGVSSSSPCVLRASGETQSTQRMLGECRRTDEQQRLAQQTHTSAHMPSPRHHATARAPHPYTRSTLLAAASVPTGGCLHGCGRGSRWRCGSALGACPAPCCCHGGGQCHLESASPPPCRCAPGHQGSRVARFGSCSNTQGVSRRPWSKQADTQPHTHSHSHTQAQHPAEPAPATHSRIIFAMRRFSAGDG